MWINGGYFVLRQDVFDVLRKGEDLVGDAFPRLAKEGRLLAVPHHGFWAAMDTLKERSYLEELHRRGNDPWALWTRGEPVRSNGYGLATLPDQPALAT
jgi:glucose-1-phosphate cytidylyltransferase